MYKRLLILGMLWSMVYPPSYAQAPGEARTGTTATGTLPTANAQGMIANSYDVDCYTGTANVNIPIFDYSLKGLNLGVSLSYSTKGVKVDQSASSAGLGWILNTPGMITREVRGVEDEIMINKTGDMYHTTTDYPKTAGLWYGQNVPDAINDKEADLFTATFAGRTIQFTIAYNGLVVEKKTYPDKKVSIEVDYTNTASGINPGEYADKAICYFILTDEYGTQFTFTRGIMRKRPPRK